MTLDPLSHNGKTYFTPQELCCKCDLCRPKSSGKLATAFDEALIALRVAFNQPMTVNSCCRCKQHNKVVGGNVRSLHVYDSPDWPTGGTCAVDIATDGKPQAYRDALVELAWKQGWSVGLSTNFLHLDRRTATIGLPQQIFLYTAYNGKMYEHLYKKGT